MAKGNRTITLKLPGCLQSTNMVKYSAVINALSYELKKFLSLLAVFQLCFKSDCCGAELFSLAPVLLLYVQKPKHKKIRFLKKELKKIDL